MTSRESPPCCSLHLPVSRWAALHVWGVMGAKQEGSLGGWRVWPRAYGAMQRPAAEAGQGGDGRWPCSGDAA